MGVETAVTTVPIEIVLPNLAGLAKLARVANPVGAFGAVFFYDGNTSAGAYEEAMVNEINRSRANVKASIPSHLPKINKRRKPTVPKESEKKASNKPGKEPVKEAVKEPAKETGSASESGVAKGTGNGPGQEPMPDHLYYALMAAAGSPVGRKVIEEFPAFLEANLDDPLNSAPQQITLGSVIGYSVSGTRNLLEKHVFGR